ncbi:CRISPR-associated protein Cse1 [Tistrella mobilis]|uniref:CRISPR-associated protein Cse1 n=1 Tax=Tistrella mobilis TaxID=171437 RepID=UPI0035579BC3
MPNLLENEVFTVNPLGLRTLPGLLAALGADEVDDLPALRPHQEPALHMTLVQIAALGLHQAGLTTLPADEEGWRAVLRGLTPEHPDDAPWCLVVADPAKPAFFQPPVPDGLVLKNEVPTPDGIDLLITSRNHDLKQAVARRHAAEDWAYALISVQTSEGYGGAGNHGIVRMNGGSSSRPMLGLAPLPDGHAARWPRLGARFRRDVERLLATRDQAPEIGVLYPASGGLGLTWTAPWPEGRQLALDRLDIWFVEACRRIRLEPAGDGFRARKGTSKAPRIDGKHMKGMLGDPWAPVHVVEQKSFTLAGRDFDYETLVELLLPETSQEWQLPLLARPSEAEKKQTMAVIAQALSRGNSKTEGFKSRIIPLSGKVMRGLDRGPLRTELVTLARAQVLEIKDMSRVLGNALNLMAVRGEYGRKNNKADEYIKSAKAELHRVADVMFFPHLWIRFEAEPAPGVDTTAKAEGDAATVATSQPFVTTLHDHAVRIFEAALPEIPCPSIRRPRAEARARELFSAGMRKRFSFISTSPSPRDDDDVAA